MLAGLLFALLSTAAARLCGEGGVVADGGICNREGQVCGHCRCNLCERWVCESPSTTAKEARDEEDDDDCARIGFHNDKCKDWEEGKSCGGCTCVAQKWVCGGGALVTQEPLKNSSQDRELQIGEEDCQGFNESEAELQDCTEQGKMCGNCICSHYFGDLGWLCLGGARFHQCLGVEDGKFCPSSESGEKCGECECMPDNRWACPEEPSKSLCDGVDDFTFCGWYNRGSMCGTCVCYDGDWHCPETLCDNIFPNKFCLWKNRGRTCFGCECIANRWICPETTPTRQELCANDILTGKFCRWRDEGRRCGACVCRNNRWLCRAERCAMVDSCSGEHSTEVSAEDFERSSICVLPAGLRGLELELLEPFAGDLELELYNAEWNWRVTGEGVLGRICREDSCPPGTETMGVGGGKEDYVQSPTLYNGESPGADQLERNITLDISTVEWNPDFPSKPTVYGYEVVVAGYDNGTNTGMLTYRWTCNEDPALACPCALG